MFKRLFFLTVLAVLARAGTARADVFEDPPSYSRPPIWELQGGLAAGGAPWMTGTEQPAAESTAGFTAVAFARLRFPRYTPLGLELNIVPGYGAGANLLFDALHIGRFRWHLLDVGMFRNLWSPISAARVGRDWDFTFGTGLEVRVWKNIRTTLDWRAFMPNPYRVLTDYGDFSRLVYAEALKGGQVWLGVTYSR